MGMELRTANPDDATRAGHICYQAFRAIAERHGFPPDFPSPEVAEQLLRETFARPDVCALAAEMDGRVVGTNVLWERDEVAGVGPITVDPGAQDGRIGYRLMQAVLERARLRGIDAVRLVQAAYHSRSLSLYAKLGFAVREPLCAMQGDPIGEPVEGFRVRPATPEDVQAASQLCRAVHGHARTQELRDAIDKATATVAEQDGHIAGYATDIAFFGHAVAHTTAALQALIAAAPAFGGPGFLVPLRNEALFRWCLERGLRVVQPMTLMSIGPYREPQGAFLPSVLY